MDEIYTEIRHINVPKLWVYDRVSIEFIVLKSGPFLMAWCDQTTARRYLGRREIDQVRVSKSRPYLYQRASSPLFRLIFRTKYRSYTRSLIALTCLDSELISPLSTFASVNMKAYYRL